MRKIASILLSISLLAPLSLFAEEKRELVFAGVLRCDEAFCKVVSLEGTMGLQKIYVTLLPGRSMTEYLDLPVVVMGVDISMFHSTRRIRVARIRAATRKELSQGKLSHF